MFGVANDSLSDRPGWARFSLLIRPDCSLSPSGVKAIVLIFSLVAFLIGGFMLILGAWPVLPFLGLEVAVLVVVFLMLQRRSTFYDLVEARGDHVSLRQKSQYGETSGTLNRYWAQIKLSGGRHWYPSKLLVGSHGKFVEIGTTLTEEDRIRTAKELQRAL